MKTTQNNACPAPPVSRRLVIAVGLLCLLISLSSAALAGFFIYVLIIRQGHLDRTNFIITGVLVLFVFSFAGLSWRYCRKDSQKTAFNFSEVLSKYNDGHWCVGVFGIIGGGLTILLILGHVIDLVAKHALALFVVVYFGIGIQSYLTWRWKQKYVKALQTFTIETETFLQKVSEMSAQLEEISKAQPPTAPYSEPATRPPQG